MVLSKLALLDQQQRHQTQILQRILETLQRSDVPLSNKQTKLDLQFIKFLETVNGQFISTI